MTEVASRPAFALVWVAILAVLAVCAFALLSTSVGRQGLVDERVRVIEALGGTSFESPGGLVTIDGQTNHAVMDVYVCIGDRNQRFKTLEVHKQQKPADTQAVCDLVKNPNDDTQYMIDIK